MADGDTSSRPGPVQMTKPKTRIQERNSRAILEAGLDVFSAHGFRGATLDQIAEAAGLSKPNLLYYFPSKDAIYLTLLEHQLQTWLDPLRAMDPLGEPMSAASWNWPAISPAKAACSPMRSCKAPRV